MMRKSKSPTSPLQCVALRLTPGQDLKVELMKFAGVNDADAACVISSVGSVHPLHLRLANQTIGILRKGYFEIIGLTGTFSSTTAHLHLSASDKNGKIIGGHLLEGTLIYTTAELVVGLLPALTFDRQPDPETGYMELKVRRRAKRK